MGDWKAIALPEVTKEAIAKSLRFRGIEWDECAHVTATGSLAQALQVDGTLAIPMPMLVDLIVHDGLHTDARVEISMYPPWQEWGRGTDLDRKNYAMASRAWQRRLEGKRTWFGMAHQQHMRDFLRTRGYAHKVVRVLLDSMWEFLRSSQILVAAGLRPASLRPSDDIGKAALDAWVDLERTYPDFAAVREDLWIDIDEFRQGESDRAVNLQGRLRLGLDHVFGKSEPSTKIVWHGFHYFTPPQFAFFNLLKNLAGIDQYFVVHDDGRSAVFEPWRRFFGEGRGMPVVEQEYDGFDPNLQASAILAGLKGDYVHPDQLAASLEIRRCRTPTEFVRDWISSVGVSDDDLTEYPRVFAASKMDLSRYIDRFGHVASPGETRLSMLPIGAYLYQIHDSIWIDSNGEARTRIKPESLVDIATSGFLQTSHHGIVGLEVSSILSRALRFFDDCETSEDWEQRALRLRDTVLNRVVSQNRNQQSSSDDRRIDDAVRNILRLAPWADLSAEQVRLVHDIVCSVSKLVREIGRKERLSLKDHVEFIKPNLLRALERLSPDERAEYEERVQGMSVANDIEVSVDSLIDFVQLLLGAKADFSVTGEEYEQQSMVKSLEHLDALGFKKVDGEVHVTNLSDAAFPSRFTAVGWPYQLKDLEKDGVDIPSVSLELLSIRAEVTGLDDLYLLYLALNGVNEGKVKLSYIERMGSDLRNPSPVLSLISDLDERIPEATRARAGGLPIDEVASPADEQPARELRSPACSAAGEVDLDHAKTIVNKVALASALACPRRFAIQWAMGPSAAYQSDHHHLMLYGNLIGALPKTGLMNPAVAKHTCDMLWPQYTAGERKSSQENAAIRIDSGAQGQWIYTLAGTKDGQKPLDRAYQGAFSARRGRLELEDDDIVPKDSGYLPPSHTFDEKSVCQNCPVRPRCAEWRSDL